MNQQKKIVQLSFVNEGGDAVLDTDFKASLPMTVSLAASNELSYLSLPLTILKSARKDRILILAIKDTSEKRYSVLAIKFVNKAPAKLEKDDFLIKFAASFDPITRESSSADPYLDAVFFQPNLWKPDTSHSWLRRLYSIDYSGMELGLRAAKTTIQSSEGDDAFFTYAYHRQGSIIDTILLLRGDISRVTTKESYGAYFSGLYNLIGDYNYLILPYIEYRRQDIEETLSINPNDTNVYVAKDTIRLSKPFNPSPSHTLVSEFFIGTGINLDIEAHDYVIRANVILGYSFYSHRESVNASTDIQSIIDHITENNWGYLMSCQAMERSFGFFLGIDARGSLQNFSANFGPPEFYVYVGKATPFINIGELLKL